MTTPNAMHDMTGWRSVTCREADVIRRGGSGLHVASTLTDPDCRYGRPLIFTEWWWDDEPVLREYRDPDENCTHFIAFDSIACLRESDDD